MHSTIGLRFVNLEVETEGNKLEMWCIKLVIEMTNNNALLLMYLVGLTNLVIPFTRSLRMWVSTF